MTNKEALTLSFDEIKKAERGFIFYDTLENGIRFIVIRGPCSLCAYIGVSLQHPLANFNYDNIPINCHHGLTFAARGDGKYHPENYYWYGWDYAHLEDYAFYYDDSTKLAESGDKKWTVKDVVEDSWETVYDFKRLVKLIEKIENKLK